MVEGILAVEEVEALLLVGDDERVEYIDCSMAVELELIDDGVVLELALEEDNLFGALQLVLVANKLVLVVVVVLV